MRGTGPSKKLSQETEKMAIKRTKTDSKGRTWVYNDAEGSWNCEEHIIGCGKRNGSKWQIWDGPSKGCYEYETLKRAMENC